MKLRIKTLTLIGSIVLGFTFFASSANAQFDNRPYQFRGGGTSGMSDAGREAILRQKLFDETPDNLVRQGGELLQVQEGPGKTAIVSEQGGQVIPRFRGRSTFRRSLGQEVGVFNPFFVAGLSPGRSYGGSPWDGGFRTRISIGGWTGMVTDGSNGAFSYATPIDSWTAQVYAYFAY